MFTLLFLLLGFQNPAAQLEQQLNQQQQQLDRLQQQTQALAAELNQTQQLLLRELKPECSVEARWEGPQSGGLIPTVGQNPGAFRATLFSVVSIPEDTCLPAEIRITAAYYQGSEFVCSGSVSVLQTSPVQTTVFEFRPFELELFAKWRDRQTWEQSNYHRLICYDLEGLEVRDPALRSGTLKINGSVFGKRGGLATAVLQLGIPLPPPSSVQPRAPRLFED